MMLWETVKLGERVVHVHREEHSRQRRAIAGGKRMREKSVGFEIL